MEKRNIIDKDGNVIIGMINNQEINFNYKDYRLLNFFDKEVHGIKKRFKFHHFNYYALLSENYVLAFAVVDLGYIKNMFLYLYDYSGKFLIKTEKKLLPFLKNLDFPINPDTYLIEFKEGNQFLSVKKDFSKKSLIVNANIKELNLSFEASYGMDNFPLKTVMPAGHNGWTFTEKCSNINEIKDIKIIYNSKKLDFSNSSLIYDWSGGYLKRETNWIWASFSGIAKNNETVGANFAAMVNETYDSENIFWINNKPFKEDIILFNYNKNAPYNPWEIENKAKTVKIKFFPRDEINDNTNAFLVKNSFVQFIGKFKGYFLDENNNKVEFDNLSGVTEIHKALW